MVVFAVGITDRCGMTCAPSFVRDDGAEEIALGGLTVPRPALRR